MPGRRDRRYAPTGRTARPITSPGRSARPQGAREQRRASRPGLGALSRRRSPSSWSRRGFDGRAAPVPRRRRRARRLRSRRAAAARHEPEGFDGEAWPRRRSGSGWRNAKNFYGTLAGNARRAAAVRRGQASEADHPHRPAARQLGGAAEGRMGGRAFPRRADHHLHGPRQAQAHASRRRAGRRSREPPRRLRSRRRGVRPSQECRGQPQAAGEDLSVGESAGQSA